MQDEETLQPWVDPMRLKTWSRCMGAPMSLKHVFRQRDQGKVCTSGIPSELRHKPDFVAMLNDMRWGQISKQFIPKFHQLAREISYEDDIGPTEL